MARWVALFALFAVVAGCTFTDLGRYDITRCDAPRAPTSLADDPCNALNDASAGCSVYQCDVATGTCQTRALDFDRDGDPSLACGGTDCDDHDDRRRHGGAETCDAVDNDCNGVADEDFVQTLSSRSILPLPSGFTESSISSSNGSDLVGAAVVDGNGGRCILAFRGGGEALSPPCTFPERGGVAPRQPWVRPIVADDLSFGAVFVTTPVGCAQGQLAFRSTKGGAVDAPCLAQGASLPAFLPYPDGKVVVASYLGAPVVTRADANAACKSIEPAPLDVVWVERPTAAAGTPAPRVYAERLGLGASLSTRPPALVPLDDVVLLAAPVDGAVGVWALRAPLADGSGESVVPLVAPRSLDALGEARSVAVALATVEGTRRMAIVAELGCPPAQRVVMAIARLIMPGPVVEVERSTEVAPAAARAAAPAVAWNEERKEWWVSWTSSESGGGVLVRRFNAEGLPAGAPITTSPLARMAAPRAGPPASIAYLDDLGLGEARVGCP